MPPNIVKLLRNSVDTSIVRHSPDDHVGGGARAEPAGVGATETAGTPGSVEHLAQVTNLPSW